VPVIPVQLTIREPGGLTDQTWRIDGGEESGFSYNLQGGERPTIEAVLNIPRGDDYEPTKNSQVFLDEREGEDEALYSFADGITAGTVESITVNGTTYSHTVGSGESGASIASALAALVNADSDVSATSSGSTVTVLTRHIDGTEVDVSSTAGPDVVLNFKNIRQFAGLLTDYKLSGKLGGDDPARHIATIAAGGMERVYDSIEIWPPQTFVNKTPGYIFTQLVLLAQSLGSPVQLGFIRTDGDPIPVVTYDGHVKMTDAFNSLQTQANFSGGAVWGVDPDTSEPSAFFCAPSDRVLPDSFTAEEGLEGSIEIDRDTFDYRNRQSVRISFDAFMPSVSVFAGNGSTTVWNLPHLPAQLLSAFVTTSRRSSVGGSFSSNPTGGTINIGGLTYTFVSELDNTQLFQVLIGANSAATAANLVDAINCNPATQGVKFSWPTWENNACNAIDLSGAAFTLVAKTPGTGGDNISVSSSASGFSWSDTITTGGFNGDTTPWQVIVPGGPGDNTVQNTPGTTEIVAKGAWFGPAHAQHRRVIPSGSYLVVTWRRLGADVITVEDTADVNARASSEHGTGMYHSTIDDGQLKDALTGYFEALATLQQYQHEPYSATVSTYRKFIKLGQQLTVNFSRPQWAKPAMNHSDWTVQEIAGSYERNSHGYTARIKKVLKLIRGSALNRVTTDVDFMRGLALTGKGGSSVSMVATAPSSGGGGGNGELKATFGVLRRFGAGDVSIIPNYHIVRNGGTLKDVVWKPFQPPVSSDDSVTRFDIKVSHDDGGTWESIFNPAGDYITLTSDGRTGISTDFAVSTVSGGDLGASPPVPPDIFRLDVISIANVIEGFGIEIVLQWV